MSIKFRVPTSGHDELSEGQRLLLAVIVWIGAVNTGFLLSKLPYSVVVGEFSLTAWGFGLAIAMMSLLSACVAAPIIAWNRWRYHNVFLIVSLAVLGCLTAYYAICKPII